MPDTDALIVPDTRPTRIPPVSSRPVHASRHSWPRRRTSDTRGRSSGDPPVQCEESRQQGERPYRQKQLGERRPCPRLFSPTSIHPSSHRIKRTDHVKKRCIAPSAAARALANPAFGMDVGSAAPCRPDMPAKADPPLGSTEVRLLRWRAVWDCGRAVAGFLPRGDLGEPFPSGPILGVSSVALRGVPRCSHVSRKRCWPGRPRPCFPEGVTRCNNRDRSRNPRFPGRQRTRRLCIHRPAERRRDLCGGGATCERTVSTTPPRAPRSCPRTAQVEATSQSGRQEPRAG